MTFDPAIPLSTDSPSIFPAQSQTNFGRLQTLVGADHQFNLTAAANDGYHTLIHMIPQSPAGALAGFGRLYAKTVSGVVQLYYRDDAGVEYQLTPQASTETFKVAGSASIASGTAQTILSVAYNFTGSGMLLFNSSTTCVYGIWFSRSGASTFNNMTVLPATYATNAGSSPPVSIAGFPIIQFSGTDLQVKNVDSVTHTIDWSFWVNRVP